MTQKDWFGNLNDDDNSVGRFFDALTSDYTATIERCFPRYREMLWALLDYVPGSIPVRSIVELGAGTGNLTALLADRYPEATITAVDISAESLTSCQQRLGPDRINYLQEDFRSLDFTAGSIDLVASSISVHHLEAAEKQRLFGNICRWLRPGGALAYCDQHAGETEELYRRHIDHWKRISRQAGSSDQEWEMWMEHQSQHDHHDTLGSQMQWLRDAGFQVVDCPWRYLLWTVLIAIK